MSDDIRKSGQVIFTLSIGRSKKGIKLSITAAPEVEDAIRSWGTGEAMNVLGYDRYWSPDRPQDILNVWQLPQQPNGVAGPYAYTLHAVGRPLLTPNERNEDGEPILRRGERSGEVVNLSFLRLVGITQGLTIHVTNQALSPEGLKSLADKLRTCCRSFYADFMLPVDLDIVISTQARS